MAPRAESNRVLLLAATTAYQTDDFARAARGLGVEVVLGTDRCAVLAAEWEEHLGATLALDYKKPERAARQIVERAGPIDGIVVTDEKTAVIGALAAERLGLPFNAPDAARATFDKRVMRERLAAAGVRQPAFRAYPVDTDVARVAGEVPLPAVVKPRHLSTSRGVMRADDAHELAARWRRLAALLADPEVRARDGDAAGEVLVEAFVAGPEVAFEGLLRGGALTTLAVFDKPDPLDGPFFPETIYVTPSAHDAAAIAARVAEAAAAIGLREGPVHAELRLAPDPVVIEIAARSIGGLCGRALRFGAGIGLEELIVRHAVGMEVPDARREEAASAVLMMPPPAAGVLRSVRGVEWARAVPAVRELVITARVGDSIVPLPEGHAYMGFAFAVADTAADAVAALRWVDELVRFEIAPKLT